jgi:hypothetical protein
MNFPGCFLIKLNFLDPLSPEIEISIVQIQRDTAH